MRFLSIVALSALAACFCTSAQAQSVLGQSSPGRNPPAAPTQSPAKPQHPRPVHGTNRPTASKTPVVEPQHDARPAKPVAGKAGAKPIAPAGAPPLATPVIDNKPPVPPPDPSKGSVTGLPLPRWASLRPDEVNLRAGPGTRYQIDWVYKRRDLPVRILREFGLWRLVEDQDLVKGWVHQATLIGRRTFVVTGAERTLRGSAADGASPVAILKSGVIGRIRTCEATSNWCEVQVTDYRGWLKRDDFWGTVPGEAIP